MNRYRLLYLKLPYLLKCLLRGCGVLVILSSSVGLHTIRVAGQEPETWSPQTKIPGFHPETGSPLLLADQNGVVHAFSSQWLGEESGAPVLALLYNHWSREEGWSSPNDILLPPLHTQAKVTDAFLDRFGTVHLTFYGGVDQDANIYYSKAPLANAGNATAWSTPVPVAGEANSSAIAALTGDELGNMAIIFSGTAEGLGLYVLYSSNWGDTWSDPEPLFLTNSELFPFAFNHFRAQSGLDYIVWDVRNGAGHAKQINFAQLNLVARQWSQPVRLTETDDGFGILLPALIEHNGELFVAMSGINMMRSTDGGLTWSEATKPFPHLGVNGYHSFVVDSSNNLHFLWAQRIGEPPIHGVWHSTWQDGRWTEPQAVVSGPHVVDLTGDKAFDPYDVRAVVSQGNVLLVVWRTDPGNKGNGVWYSYSVLSTKALPLATFPAEVPLPTVTPTVIPTPLALVPTATPISRLTIPKDAPSAIQSNPAMPLILGTVTTSLLLGSIAIGQIFRRRRD